MGLTINIFKCNRRADCTNGGASSRDIEGFCITNVNGPFNPCDDYPSAELVLQEFYGRKTVKIVPTHIQEGRQTSSQNYMFGGNYGASSDSRFSEKIESMIEHSFYGAVPIHDRAE
tara:strand:- start:538 stop:885 length:348 start_codon:yes stop_codon:yes gene_type:complete